VDVKHAIEERRAYRSLDPAQITDELIEDLAQSASLSASCFNKQPWRFVFVHDKEVLSQLFSAMSKGNEWTRQASLIVAVFSKKELDCVVKGREYYLFDTGMATAFLILRATERGLVAHPIAGYDEEKAKQVLKIPEDMTLITLVNVGKHADEIHKLLSEEQAKIERTRPERFPFEKFAFVNAYRQPSGH
jgi:nitroreductase